MTRGAKLDVVAFASADSQKSGTGRYSGGLLLQRATRHKRRDREQIQMNRGAWIDWGRHARTHSLVERLDLELLEVEVAGPRLARYIKSARETLRFLRKQRPLVVIVTNPSVVLCSLALLVRPFFRYRLFCDAHYFGVKASSGNALHQRALDYLNARVDLVIVTNGNHARYLNEIGGRTFVCQDPLPRIPPLPPTAAAIGEKSVFLICSFDTDEPYEAVFDAFRGLRDEGYVLYVSGNMRKSRVDLASYDWVRFLGFVPDDEYCRYLRLCDVVVDLTTNEDCLVCGAYEALSVGKPLVLSRTTAIADYFGSVAVLTDHDPAAIQASVRRAYAQRAEQSRLIWTWVAENEAYMQQKMADLKERINARY